MLAKRLRSLSLFWAKAFGGKLHQDERVLAPPLGENRYKLLVENITDYAIYMLDPEGFIASWNIGAQRSKGYEAYEIIGKHFSRFYTEEDRKSKLPARALETAVREGKFEQEGWRVRKDGTNFWASVIIDPVRDNDGHLIGFAKVTRDLTERKKAEQSLNVSEQQFRLLVQSVSDYAIYMLDPAGYITNWNAGAELIKGYRPEEIIGQHFSKFYTKEDYERGEPQRALETALREGRYITEAWRCRKDGSKFWASVVLDPIRDEKGILLGFAKITRDITERREAEQVLEQTREALFQSQKMEAIGQLTGGVAHDFNNLLAAILGSLELALKRLPKSEQRVASLIENAVEGAKRGAALTQRLLAFARRQDLKPKPIALRDLVDGITELLQRSLGPQIYLENKIPKSIPLINADENQVEMALLNLTMNARDSMPRGGPILINASVMPGEGSRSFVCLSVTDKGEGMDERTLRKATEPFFTTKGIGKGTGLGLSMVNGLAEQSGGSFRLYSKLGEGTRAELWLPIAENQEISASAAFDEGTSESALPNTLTVLAVDDDPLVLMNTAAMLEELGHNVIEAYSGLRALEILKSGKQVDIIVTDQAMPHMTGLELAIRIQADWPEMRIVIATGYAELPSESRVNFARLSKPFLEKDLALAIGHAPPSGNLA